jgi:ParB-like chromosome segregation protein Spo0J
MLSKAIAERIEHWVLDKLKIHPKNARKHSEAQIALVAGSIAAYGFNAPILVDAETEPGVIHTGESARRRRSL